MKKAAVKFADDDDVEMSESEDDGLFVNPLLSVTMKNGGKPKKEEEDDESDDEAKEGDGFSSADEADEKMIKK